MSVRLLPLALVLVSSSCSPPSAPAAPTRPYVLVLGTAQDGGLPQIGCRAACCERVRTHPEARRCVTSLLLADPRTGDRWLLDASPDLAEQVERAEGHPASRVEAGARPALFDGVFLTHAHMGHYTGLLELGREAYGARGLPVYGTDRMGAFLRDNGPWSQLVETSGIELRRLVPGDPVRLGDDLEVTALLVPHRDEFSDTVAFLIRGPSRRLLYLPDIDQWDRWGMAIEDVLARVDVALIDGTFFSEHEIPGRTIEDIPHPLIRESLRRFAGLPEAERAKVHFTHLNHSNPVADPTSPEAGAVRDAGLHVAEERQVFRL